MTKINSVSLRKSGYTNPDGSSKLRNRNKCLTIDKQESEYALLANVFIVNLENTR